MNKYSVTKKIALTALISATLTVVKFALSFIPNVEGVTVLIAVFTSVFGLSVSLCAVLIFVLNETLIYGMGLWVISYFIYWPLLVIVFSALKFFKMRDLYYKITAVIMTVFFGVLTSLVDTGLFTGFYDNFFARFAIIYVRGIVFYSVHIVCNIFVFVFLFSPLKKFIQRCGYKFISKKEFKILSDLTVSDKDKKVADLSVLNLKLKNTNLSDKENTVKLSGYGKNISESINLSNEINENKKLK